MAEKEWLIRTQNFQILGPITKSKLKDLIEKKSLAAKDEICCGNGYWFLVEEKDLVDKYIYGNARQSFNPISEADDTIPVDEVNGVVPDLPVAEEEVPPPLEEDSVLGSSFISEEGDIESEDITLVKEIPVSELLDNIEEGIDIKAPANPPEKIPPNKPAAKSEIDLRPKVNTAEAFPQSKNPGNVKRKSALVAVLLIVIIVVFYLYKDLVLASLGDISKIIFNDANAQPLVEQVKKKV